MNKFNARAALAFGALGAAITFLPLAGFILFAAGMNDCQDCGLPPDAFGALFFAAALATLFGVVTGSASAWLKRYTGDFDWPTSRNCRTDDRDRCTGISDHMGGSEVLRLCNLSSHSHGPASTG